MPNYGPMGYGSYPYMQPNFQGGVQPNFYPGMQPPQSNYPQQNQSNNVQMNQYAFVNGIEGAKSYQVQPNQTILLMDSDNPICYMKTANAMGQSTLRYFRLQEISEQDTRDIMNPQMNKPTNTNDYVLKADFDALSKRLDDLTRKIEKPSRASGNKENKEE